MSFLHLLLAWDRTLLCKHWTCVILLWPGRPVQLAPAEPPPVSHHWVYTWNGRQVQQRKTSIWWKAGVHFTVRPRPLPTYKSTIKIRSLKENFFNWENIFQFRHISLSMLHAHSNALLGLAVNLRTWLGIMFSMYPTCIVESLACSDGHSVYHYSNTSNGVYAAQHPEIAVQV